MFLSPHQPLVSHSRAVGHLNGRDEMAVCVASRQTQNCSWKPPRGHASSKHSLSEPLPCVASRWIASRATTCSNRRAGTPRRNILSEPLPVAETFTFVDEATGVSLSDVATLDTLVSVVDCARFEVKKRRV